MEICDDLVLAAGGLMMIMIIGMRFKNRGLSVKNNSLFNFINQCSDFWGCLSISADELTLFAKYNVNLHLFGFPIAPGWIQNI